ncbi:hypothetical protein BH23VER1_BH23VER1_21670 [soil metagenome]
MAIPPGHSSEDSWEEFYFPGDLTQLGEGQDYDSDGLDDDQEFRLGTNPTVPDTDGDGLLDGEEDATGNYVAGTNAGSSPLLADTDGDGISDFDEFFGDPATNPNLADSDGDSFSDPDEIAALSDPNDINDTPLTFVVADSVAEFSGTQEQDGWSYGYYDFTNDADSMYAAADLILFPRDEAQGGVASPPNFWKGTAWDWFAGNPPWTTVGATSSHPNGSNHPSPNNAEHWAVKRWEATGLGGPTTASLIWSLRKTDGAGNGVTGYLFVNGVEVDRLSILGPDTAGVTGRRVWVDINDGDIIDIALSPEGYYGRDDGNDSSFIALTVDTRFRDLARQPDGRWYAAPGFTDTDADNLVVLWDTDGDGVGDGEEIDHGSDPLDRFSKPGTNVVASSDGDFTFTGENPDGEWTYGYRNVSADGGGVDYGPVDDFILFDPASHWTGSSFDLASMAPWTQVSRTGGHPNGTNNGQEHWAAYRWTPPYPQKTPVAITYTLAKQNTNGGDGTSVGLYLNGMIVAAGAVAGTDGVGIAGTYYLDVDSSDVVDLALKPQGPAGTGSQDGADGSFFGFVVDAFIPLRPRQPDGSEFVPSGSIPVLFKITSLQRIGFGAADISWVSLPGRTYRIETSVDLATWSPLVSGFGSQGSVTTYRDESGFADSAAGLGFYRVVEE